MGKREFKEIYQALYDHYGPQNWWPGETPFEISVGAVLTQNTNWQNVEKAIYNLKQNQLMDFDSLVEIEQGVLAELIRPSGYYNLKAKRLKNLLAMVVEKYDGKLSALLEDETFEARNNLLSVKGVGPETADAILLYAGLKPIFVVDAYTHRVFSRHNLVSEETDYQTIQDDFMANLELNHQIFNEYHALIVRVAKEFCKKQGPRCEACPIEGI